jgi:diguanylate cyclase (GGDEF)-like protein
VGKSNLDLPSQIRAAHERLADGDLARAREIAADIMGMARSHGDDALLGEALEVLALAHARCGDPVSGLTAALEGARLAAGRADALGEARCRMMAGNAYIELSEPADALVALERAITCMEGIDDAKLEAEVLHVAGWAMKEVGRAAAGRDLALRAVTLARGNGSRRLQADALVSLGDIEADLAAAMVASPERDVVLDRAQAALEEAAILARSVGSANFEGRALGNLGAVWALRGEHDVAIEVQGRALAMMLEGGDIHAAIESYARVGRSERALGRVDAAREHLMRCIELADNRGAKFDVARAHEELALIDESVGEFEAAYRHLACTRLLEREIVGDRAVRSAELMALRVAAEESSREAAQLREQSRTLTELSQQLRREREMFAQQALLDPLTGLANRRALDYTFAALARDAPSSMNTVAVADIDHFKAINDRFGHAAGDEVLRAAAAILERFARREDLVCRYGGEEFVLLLGSYDQGVSRSVTERIRAAVEAHPWENIASGLRVTISIGVAAGSAADLYQLLQAADALLYRAKRAGRNHVEHARPRRVGANKRGRQAVTAVTLPPAP